MSDTDKDKWYEYLDELSEIQKLGNKGRGDLEDNCFVCGISPSKHKQFIEALIQEQVRLARIDELQHSLEHIPMRIGELVDYKAERLAKLKAGDE
jgi:hypothetical protein